MFLVFFFTKLEEFSLVSFTMLWKRFSFFVPLNLYSVILNRLSLSGLHWTGYGITQTLIVIF